MIGFNGFHDGSGYYIGDKMLDTLENLTMADDEEKMLSVILNFDFSAGKQLIFC